MTVSETTSEARRATVTATENGVKISPVMPPTNAMGRKTATVVSVEEVTAPATSRTAVVITANFSPPYPRWRLMFSSTTMESSTTRPIETVKALRVRRFSE